MTLGNLLAEAAESSANLCYELVSFLSRITFYIAREETLFLFLGMMVSNSHLSFTLLSGPLKHFPLVSILFD